MTPEQAARAVAALFEDGGGEVLRAARVPSWEAWCATLPEAARAKAGAHAVPGLLIAFALRDGARSGGDLASLRAAAALTRALVQTLGDRLGDDHPDVLAELGALGVLAGRAGRPDDAVTLLEEAWTGLRAHGLDGRAVRVGAALAGERIGRDAPGDAVRATEVLDLCLAAWSRPDRLRLQLLDRRLHVAWEADDLDGAAAASEEAWALAVAGGLRGAARVALATRRAAVLGRQGRHGEAADLIEGVLAAAPTAEEVPLRATRLRHLDAAGRAHAVWRELDVLLRWARGPAGVGAVEAVLEVQRIAAGLYTRHGRLDEAEAVLREELEVRAHRVPDPGDPLQGPPTAQARLGRLLLARGRVEEAIGWLESAVAFLGPVERARPDGAPAGEGAEAAHALVTALHRHATALQAAGRAAEAAEAAHHALPLLGDLVGWGHPAAGALQELAGR